MKHETTPDHDTIIDNIEIDFQIKIITVLRGQTYCNIQNIIVHINFIQVNFAFQFSRFSICSRRSTCFQSINSGFPSNLWVWLLAYKAKVIVKRIVSPLVIPTKNSNFEMPISFLIGGGTASPLRQNFVCLVRSRLRCHVRRHRHARNKGKFGNYAFQSCRMLYEFLTFIVLNKMNLSLLKLFSFTFMWES